MAYQIPSTMLVDDNYQEKATSVLLDASEFFCKLLEMIQDDVYDVLA